MKKFVFVLLFSYCLCSILNSDIMVLRYGTFNFNAFEPEIIDSRAESLGRTSLFTTSGANNLFNNPSILSRLDRKNVQVSFRTHYGEAKQKRENSSITYTDYYKTHIKLNGISVVTPYFNLTNRMFKFNFAIGYRSYIDRGYKRETTEYTYDSDGGLNLLVFGSSICMRDKYYFGFSYNYPILSIISTKTIYKSGTYDDIKTSGTMKASFFIFSSSYKINETISIGIRFRPSVILKKEYQIDDDEDIEIKIEYDVPYELAFAAKISPSKQLNIFTEYLTCNLGEYKSNDDYMYSLDDNGKSENGYSIRVGFEYKEKFRFGFFSQTVPIYKSSFYSQEVSKKPQTEFGFTSGFGFNIYSNFILNMFSSYSILNYDEYNNFTTEYSDFRIKAGCSVGYSF